MFNFLPRLLLALVLFSTAAQADRQVTDQLNRQVTLQLYLQDVTASVSRPVKELRNFKKVTLKAGQSQQVELPISEDDLKFYNASLKWGAEPGKFNVFVGLDSDNVQAQSFTLK